MPTWLKIILLLIPTYIILGLLTATVVATYKYIVKNEKFKSNFKEIWNLFLFEIFDPTNYF
ncbi:hypothetical protein P7H60_09590 [Vagococcus carniphilus]|uniref:hypothetical protein n=1 Tax=Vagococcus carniphilus TaxID=218144 RepID=UPI0028908465|nr:hypothetical protein [Vagococcus carniphilus]MDT2814526.1 hypothetical protein [Vagococcus carniphilus]MDT2849409.1 hypothetical protein [Vagococcus carniphilus]MDT2864147.1 hypothetical protein [Vagococcus carniphilus]